MSADDQWVAVVADSIEAELRLWFVGHVNAVELREAAEACAARARRDLELVDPDWAPKPWIESR